MATIARRCGLAAAVLFCLAGINGAADDIGSSSFEAGAETTWQGTWNNRKYKTDGPLICTVTARDSDTWQAVFTGKGLGKPFEYNVTIKATKRGSKTILQGTSRIDGDNYQWNGTIERKQLVGLYRSASGNNGEFRLTEK